MSRNSWFLLLIVLLLVWRWWSRSRSFRVCNGFWQYGYLTNPGVGCQGTSSCSDSPGSACSSSSACSQAATKNMKYYLQFWNTSLAVGQLDPAYNAGGGSGSQKNLVLTTSGSPFVIAPLYNAANASYFAWRFIYPSAMNYLLSDPELDRSHRNQNAMLYNEAADSCWAPIIGPFLQGNPSNWNEDGTNWPPRWIAHTLVRGTSVAADFKVIYPFSWDFPDSMIPNASQSPEGEDPQNGKTVAGVPTLRVRIFLPDTQGDTGGKGTWWTYYALSGSGYDGDASLLSGPVNLSITWQGTSPQSPGRFWMNCYWRQDVVPNEVAAIRAMSGGGSDGKGCNSPNGKQLQNGTCMCSSGSLGWNCIYPRPAMPDWSELDSNQQ